MEFIRRETDYAVRVLSLMAANPQKKIFDAASLSKKENIPTEFLYKILRKLHFKGIINSHRGPSGGYSLATNSKNITLLKLVEIIQGPVKINRCSLGKNKCSQKSVCSINSKWLSLQKQFTDNLKKETINDIAKIKKKSIAV